MRRTLVVAAASALLAACIGGVPSGSAAGQAPRAVAQPRQAPASYEAREDAIVAALARATLEERGAPICLRATLAVSSRQYMHLAAARQEAGSDMARLFRRHRRGAAVFGEGTRRLDPHVLSQAELRTRTAAAADCEQLIVEFMRPHVAADTAFISRAYLGPCGSGFDDVVLTRANGEWRVAGRGPVGRLGGVGPPCPRNAKVAFPTEPNSVIYIEGAGR